MLENLKDKLPLIRHIDDYILQHKKFGEFIRYVIVGGSCAVADLAFLYILVEFFHIWYLFSATLSFITVSSFGYFGQKYFTFKNNSKNYKKQMPVFFVVAGTGLLINSLCMFTFVSILGIWYILSNVITKFIVLIWNFLANKYLTFRDDKKRQD